MKRIKPLVVDMKDGSPYVSFSCVDENDVLIEAISLTLLDLIQMSYWAKNSLEELRSLVQQAESGRYVSPNKKLSDFGVNDVNLWLDEPMAPKGMLVVTNENTIYDSESSDIQRFTFSQFWCAFYLWQEVDAFIAEHGKAALRDNKFEIVFQ